MSDDDSEPLVLAMLAAANAVLEHGTVLSRNASGQVVAFAIPAEHRDELASRVDDLQNYYDPDFP